MTTARRAEDVDRRERAENRRVQIDGETAGGDGLGSAERNGNLGSATRSDRRAREDRCDWDGSSEKGVAKEEARSYRK